MAFNQDVKALIPHRGLLSPDYLLRVLQAMGPDVIRDGVKKGATVHSLRSGLLEGLRIPLPPLPEQRRIAAMLTEQMAAVNKARAAVQAQLEAARALTGAYLREVFESEEAKRWPQRYLADLGEVVAGVTLGRRLEGKITHQVPYLRVANVKDGHLDLNEVFDTEATETEIKKLQLAKWDLVLTEGGDLDKLGRGTLWRDELPECIHQNHIFRVRFTFPELSPEFAALQIGSTYGKAYFLRHAKQTTGIATINQKVLGAFPMMIPPLGQQREIIALFNHRSEAIHRLCWELEHGLQAIDALPAALLSDALQGGH